MSRNLDLALTLKARDEMSRPVAKAMQDVARQTQVAERAVIGLSRESQRMASAREQLGVRSEQTIQREIRQTEAAYQRLARAGTLSGREQARAYEAMRDKVAGLRREMAGVSQLQRGMATGARGLVAAGASVAAGAYTLSRPLQRVEDYDLRLRYMANTAYAEQGLDGRRTGMRELDEAVRKAVANGGNRDAAAETLDRLIASGSLGDGAAGRKAAMDLLPTLTKYATAANADPNELADIALKAKKTLKIGDSDFPKVLEMAMLGGKLGGFELKDMAKWLPQQMAAASAAGLTGTKGLAKLVALNQNAVVTAGSKDEAGNNVVNFLAKLNAEETSKDFKKVGVNWRQQLVNGAKQGKDAVDVFGDAITGLLKNNAAYQKLQTKLATAQGEEKKAALDAMAAIVQGAVVGKISSDRQELMAVIAMLNDRAGMTEIEQKVRNVNPGDVVNTDLALIQDSAAWKGQQGGNKWAEKQFDSLSGLSSTVGDVKLKLAEYADKYPALSTAMVGATTALTALAAAAGAAGLANVLTGGGMGAGGPLLSRALGGAGALLRAGGGVAMAGAAGYGVGSLINYGITGVLTATNGGKERTLGTWLADLANGGKDAKLLAPTPLPRRNEPSAAAPIPQLSLLQSTVNASTRLDVAAKTMQQAVSQPIPVKVTVDVKNGNIVAAVNATNSSTARRY